MSLYLEKLYYRYFLTQINPVFNIITSSKFLSVPFCVKALDSLINYSFSMNSVFKKALLSLLFHTQNHSFIDLDFFLQNNYPFTL